MKGYTLIGFLAILMVIASCKKEDLKPDTDADLSETPVFKVQGTIDGSPVEFLAGVDGMYLSTYSYQVNGVDKFCGSLTDGDNYVKVGVFNGNLGAPQLVPFPAMNTIGFTSPFLFPLIKINTEAMVNGSYVTQLNFVVDGESVGNQLILSDAGKYEVCAEITFYDGTQRTVCNTLILGYNDLAPYELKHFCDLDGNVKAWVDTDQSLTGVQWFVDGELYSEDELLEISFGQVGGVHTLMSRATFANGVVRDHTVLVDGSGSARFFEDIYRYKVAINSNVLRDFKATLDLKVNGQQYTNVSYAVNSCINVDDISYFGKNAAGKDVYMIKGSIQVPVRNVQTQEQVNADLSIVFGLERP